MSGPSTNANDWTEGEARNKDESYDSSDSAAQSDSGIAGLDGVSRCSMVEGIVGASSLDGVAVTDDSLGLRELETMMDGSVRDSSEGMGEGPGTDSVTDNSVLEGGTVEGVGTCLLSSSPDSSLGSTEGLYVDEGNGISSGCSSPTSGNSMSSGTEEGIVGISDGATRLSTSSSRFVRHLHSAVWYSVETSVGHTSAVTYSEGSVGHTSAVT